MPVLKTLKRKFGISASRVAVHAHLPWYLRWLGILAVGVLVMGVGWATYDLGMEFAGFRQGEADRALAKLNEAIKRQQEELAEFRMKVAAGERQLQIERATYGDLAKQVKSLTEENATLKEDLAFFQSVMPTAGNDGAITINRFKLQPGAFPGEYRYQLLLVHAGQRAKAFQGSLQFVLNLQQHDRKVVLTLPPENDKNAREYRLEFKLFKRLEGTFRIAPDAEVKSMQVRVFENGSNAPKLTQTVNIS